MPVSNPGFPHPRVDCPARGWRLETNVPFFSTTLARESKTIFASAILFSLLSAHLVLPLNSATAGRILEGPSDVAPEVGVGQKLRDRLIARHGDEGDLKTRASGVLHGRDAIGIVGG